MEISPALAEIACGNLASPHDPKRIARDVTIVRTDAAAYAFPRGDLVVFLFHPFSGPVLERVLANLCAGEEQREIVLLYYVPVERATIDAHGAFEVAADLEFGLVYRRRR